MPDLLDDFEGWRQERALAPRDFSVAAYRAELKARQDAALVDELRIMWSNHMDFPGESTRNAHLIRAADELLNPELQPAAVERSITA